MTPEQKLFQAIVTQCVIDATDSPPRKPIYQEWVAKRRAREAKRGVTTSDILLSEAWEHLLRCYSAQLIRFDTDQRSARIWLTSGGPDFMLFCNLAGYEPDYIRDNARKLERNGWNPAGSVQLQAA